MDWEDKCNIAGNPQILSGPPADGRQLRVTPDENPDLFTWLDGTLPLMDPFAEGHYVNEVKGRRHPDRYRLCYSETNWQRLRQARQQFDPAGVFHDYLGSS